MISAEFALLNCCSSRNLAERGSKVVDESEEVQETLLLNLTTKNHDVVLKERKGEREVDLHSKLEARSSQEVQKWRRESSQARTCGIL